MFSKVSYRLFFVLIVSVITSCGILGDKPKKDPVARFGASTDCLNDLSRKINSYIDGTIEELTLRQTLDCTIDAHKDFKRFIRGNEQKGNYLPEDVHSFVTKTLMTDRTLDLALIESTFELKASLFGGKKSYFSKENIDQLIHFLEVLKVEAVHLLPYIRDLRTLKTPEAASAFSAQLSQSVSRFFDEIELEGGSFLKKEQLDRFFRVLSKEFDFEVPEHLVSQITHGKAVLVGGKQSGIEGKLWRPFLKSVGMMLSPALSYMAVKDEKFVSNSRNDLLLQLSQDFKKGIEFAFQSNHGKLSLDSIKKFLEVSPSNWIIGDKKLFFDTIDKVFMKVLSAPIIGGEIYFDQFVLDTLLNRFERYVKGGSLIDRVFYDYGFDFQRAKENDLLDALEIEREKLTDPIEIEELDRLVRLILLHPSFYAYGKEKMILDFGTHHSFENLKRFHWINLALEHVMQAYSAQPTRDRATLEKLTEIYNDFEEFAFSQKWIDATVPGWPDRRFREADLFTFVSNGDQFIDIEEATELLGISFSVSHVVSQVRADIGPICNTTELDPLDWYWMDPVCFRKEYFKRALHYWDNAPMLTSIYSSLSGNDLEDFQKAIEVGARRYGYSDTELVGSYDAVSTVGLYHYLDMMMLRYDVDQDEHLDTLEVQWAFPTFKLLLADVAGLDPVSDEKNLRGLFSYIIKHGRPPKLDNLWDKLMFAKWANFPGTWNINANRRDLYKIITFFAVEEPK